MSRLVLACAAVGVLAGLGLVSSLATAQHESAAGASAAQITADLRIEAEVLTSGVLQVGTPVQLGATLVNRSETVTHRVVAPGDGSESGWREPHVYYTGQRQAGDGTWTDLERRGIGRCGMYDRNWHDEVRELGPGESIDLNPWTALPAQVFDLGSAGKFRVRVHYRYAGGTLGKGVSERADPGPMKGVPAFDLVSKPIEFEIVRGLELEVRVLREIPRGVPIKLSELLGARLVNHFAEERDVIRSDWQATVQTVPHDALPAYHDPLLTFVRPPDPTTLAPGASLPLFGTAFDTEFTYRGQEPFTIRLALRRRGENGTHVTADGVEIRVAD